MDTGEQIRIDDQTYEVAGEIGFTEGSGDGSTSWVFYGLRRASDGAKLYLEENGDGAKLYAPLDDSVKAPALDEVDLERDLTSVVDGAFTQFMEGAERKLVWGRVTSRLGAAPAPFTGTRGLLLYRGANEQYPLAVFYAQSVIKEQDGVYYSAMWPAAQIERYPVERAKIPTGLLPINYAAALAVGVLAMLPLGLPDAGVDTVSAFWFIGFAAWAARLFGRSTPFYVGAHIVSSAFLVWFCTRLIDNYWATNAEFQANQYMAARIGCLVIGLAVIRMLSRRVYFMIADGAKWGGGTAVACYVCGILFASMMEEYWFGRHFDWYVGDTPWGYIWAVCLVLAVLYKISDYMHVPLTFRAFVAQVEQLRTACKGGPGEVQRNSAALVVVADDLGDAANISDDPDIAALHHLNETFFTISKVIEKLGEAEPEDFDLALLTDDLKVLCDDLGDLVTPARGPLQSLRISPQGRVLTLD